MVTSSHDQLRQYKMWHPMAMLQADISS